MARATPTFHEVPWTAELEPLRRRLQSTESGRDGFFVRPGSLVDHPLALAFPLVDAGSGEPHAERWGRFRVTGVVLLQLDQDYLSGQLFPQLAEANFGPVADSEFDVAVVRRDDRSIVFSTDPARTGTLAPLPGDVQRSLPGRGRVGPDRRERAPTGATGSPARASASDRPTTPPRPPAKGGGQPRKRAPG